MVSSACRRSFVVALSMFIVYPVCAGDVAQDLPKETEFEKAVRVPGGDWIVYRYHGSADSGVHVSRMDSKMTDQRWRIYCIPLGVEHSKYRHTVEVTLVADRMKVASVGSSGEFEEWLDLATGKQISRKTKWATELWRTS